MEWPCKTCECSKAPYACEQSTCEKVQSYKTLQAIADHLEVAKIAYDMVLKTMKEGEVKYPDHRWKKQSIEQHLYHADAHMDRRFIQLKQNIESDEDDIAHAMTRLAMIRWKEMREKGNE